MFPRLASFDFLGDPLAMRCVHAGGDDHDVRPGNPSKYGVLEVLEAGSVVDRAVSGNRIVGRQDTRLPARPGLPNNPLTQFPVVTGVRPGVTDADMYTVCAD